MDKPPLRRIIHNIAQKIKRGVSLYFRKVKPLHQASREELLRLLPSVELPECVKQSLYEAGVMRALEDYEEEGVLTGYEVDPNAFTVGTPGNTPTSLAAITAVRKEMNDNKGNADKMKLPRFAQMRCAYRGFVDDERTV